MRIKTLTDVSANFQVLDRDEQNSVLGGGVIRWSDGTVGLTDINAYKFGRGEAIFVDDNNASTIGGGYLTYHKYSNEFGGYSWDETVGTNGIGDNSLTFVGVTEMGLVGYNADLWAGYSLYRNNLNGDYVSVFINYSSTMTSSDDNSITYFDNITGGYYTISKQLPDKYEPLWASNFHDNGDGSGYLWINGSRVDVNSLGNRFTIDHYTEGNHGQIVYKDNVTGVYFRFADNDKTSTTIFSLEEEIYVDNLTGKQHARAPIATGGYYSDDLFIVANGGLATGIAATYIDGNSNSDTINGAIQYWDPIVNQYVTINTMLPDGRSRFESFEKDWYIDKVTGVSYMISDDSFVKILNTDYDTLIDPNGHVYDFVEMMDVTTKTIYNEITGTYYNEIDKTSTLIHTGYDTTRKWWEEEGQFLYAAAQQKEEEEKRRAALISSGPVSTGGGFKSYSQQLNEFEQNNTDPTKQFHYKPQSEQWWEKTHSWAPEDYPLTYNLTPNVSTSTPSSEYMEQMITGIIINADQLDLGTPIGQMPTGYQTNTYYRKFELTQEIETDSYSGTETLKIIIFRQVRELILTPPNNL